MSASKSCDLIGVPFDGGSTLGWPGSRYAPDRIRRGLNWMRMRSEGGRVWAADTDAVLAFAADFLRDVGDIEVVGHDLMETGRRTSAAVQRTVESGHVPVVIGGDDSLLFPSVRGLHDAVDGTVGLVHFDAHLDLLDQNVYQGSYSHSSGVRRCLDLRRFRPDATVQVGVRNFNFPSSRQLIADTGITEVTAASIQTRGLPTSIETIMAVMDRADHVFLSFDIDAVDPAHAPGAGAHEPGGLTSRDALDAVRFLAPLVDGFAITEVNPMTDQNDVTSTLAAYLVFNFAIHRGQPEPSAPFH